LPAVITKLDDDLNAAIEWATWSHDPGARWSQRVAISEPFVIIAAACERVLQGDRP
jgi:hypothetical protein